MLKISKLKKTFYKKEILKNIDITFEKGRIYSVLGGNGSGKTTLFQCISEDLKYTDGNITIRNGAGAMLAEKHGMLPSYLTGYQFIRFLQESTLDRSQCFESRLESLETETDINQENDETDQILDLVMFDNGKRHLLIKDYDSETRKKLQLAAFLVKQPYVMMFDELLDYCDSDFVGEFIDVLLKVKDEHIILISTSQLEVAKEIPGQIVLLNNGELSPVERESLENEEFEKSVLELLGEDENE